ncbi:MAG: tRNA (N(6)-L-threonylcarbamoyladenosine(37)-C(2))-methylthiotransferase MtaB [Oscillospiraceae bacterium]|jgi:threonylcarbamoyladenosine tRNA methylthiotransferase MtaB|nr:tRNA (N(6)-L-threonylcarbamoyladenosine(37)-C(2))-methylthiotransferase MtaB [Oscillospiraceae bacterium]
MTFHIETLGCKVNQTESAAVAELLHAHGLRRAEAEEKAAVVILNTCAVTGEASRKSRQAARRLMRENSGAALVISGCATQLEPQWARDLGAILVSGSAGRRVLASRVVRIALGEAPEPSPQSAAPLPRDLERLPGGAAPGRTRAMLKIQDGCDNFCSYCVIPRIRGRVRSLPPPEIAAEAARLSALGLREIVLNGIEISSYGRDLPDASLIDAITAASAAAPNARLRLTSLEPSTVTEELCGALSGVPNLCDHFHLSLQSGSDGVLPRMLRKYDTAGFFRALSNLRSRFPNAGVTADLICGFPGETDAQFDASLTFIGRCAFSDMHVFPYSARPGTPAAAMPDQIPHTIRRARARAARELAETMRERFIASQLGRTLPVLFERESGGRRIGYTGNYLEVSVSGALSRGDMLNVSLTRARGSEIFGELAE